MDFQQEYKSKLRTPQEAVRVVKSGDWVDYGSFHSFPQLLDKALAERKEELRGVKFRGNLIPCRVEVAECDPSREHFFYTTWHCSAYERKLVERGLCNFTPMLYRNLHAYYRNYLEVNVAMLCATPMDKHGYFNLSCTAGAVGAIIERADIIILEINENLPWVCGGKGEVIHITDVDYIVEGEHGPLAEVPTPVASPEDIAIAKHILPYIIDGATLQFGIGGLPDVLGAMIADSDLKDLGMYTEMTCDGCVDLAEAGKLTNKNNRVGEGRGVWSVAMGSRRVHEWVTENPEVASFPVDFVNSPRVMSENDNLTCIVNCVSLDLYSQFSSESAGTRQISGTGGQIDFVEGAFESKGGKCFIDLSSTRKDKEGNLVSRIVPTFAPGEIVSTPRSLAFYAATEYGVVNLAGLSTWERAEAVISLAHPDFREELIREAEKMNIWRRSNKLR